MRKKANQVVLPLAGKRSLWDVLGAAGYRWRWQLTPVYVAAALVPTAWVLAIVGRWFGWAWVLGAGAVAVVLVTAWLAVGLSRTYDRLYAGLVAAAGLIWVTATAVHPGRWWLYGALALGWPLLALGWWAGPACRSGMWLDNVLRSWTNAAASAGLDAALTNARTTPTGKVLSLVLSGRTTAREVTRERLEQLLGTRKGAVTVVPDKANVRRVEVHVNDRDPWEARGDLLHPAIGLAGLTAEDLNAEPDDEPDDADLWEENAS